ncbi:hypothetical protein, partial [Actinomyces radicidentis]|uniref:hypothetical protein n=1 Tax=Actinomyces radicidentis TaxID=111015 RepID=UPI0028F0B41A
MAVIAIVARDVELRSVRSLVMSGALDGPSIVWPPMLDLVWVNGALRDPGCSGGLSLAGVSG